MEVVEKIKRHILYSKTCPENRDIHEVMWKNILEPLRPRGNVIRRMRTANSINI
jgi:hypothetical protein